MGATGWSWRLAGRAGRAGAVGASTCRIAKLTASRSQARRRSRNLRLAGGRFTIPVVVAACPAAANAVLAFAIGAANTCAIIVVGACASSSNFRSRLLPRCALVAYPPQAGHTRGACRAFGPKDPFVGSGLLPRLARCARTARSGAPLGRMQVITQVRMQVRIQAAFSPTRTAHTPWRACSVQSRLHKERTSHRCPHSQQRTSRRRRR